MDFDIRRTVRINTSSDQEQQQVTLMLHHYPILQTAALIAQEMRQPTNYHEVDRLFHLIEHIAPQWPNDTFDAPTLASFMLYKTNFTVEEYDILHSLLPETRDLRVTMRAWDGNFALIFDASPKNGGHHTVTMKGEGEARLPFTITAERWANMDHLDNHDDECPEHKESDESDESDEELGECNCESFVEYADVLTVTKWDDKAKAQIEKFLTHTFGY